MAEKRLCEHADASLSGTWVPETVALTPSAATITRPDLITAVSKLAAAFSAPSL
jgi:hypothetical protein